MTPEEGVARELLWLIDYRAGDGRWLRAQSEIAASLAQARSEGRAAALEAAERFVRDFRNRKDWRAGRQLLNGQHDRDDAIADGIRALLNQGRDEVAPSESRAPEKEK